MTHYAERLRPMANQVACLFTFLLALLTGLLSPQTPLHAQEEAMQLSPEQQALIEKYSSIKWQSGPVKAQIGTMGEIDVPAGYSVALNKDAQTLMEVYGNPPDSSTLAAIIPDDEESEWTLIFQFDSVGYVKDDDKNSIDANAILSSFQAGLPEMNRQRRAVGSPECLGMSWTEKPFYDPQTNNLTWGLNLAFPGGSTVNYDIRMLGRRGVMEATLLGDSETYAKAVPSVKTLLSNYRFTSGNTYAEWAPGDKVAEYGLTGLVVGGGLAVAAKTGLLAKLGLLFAKAGKLIIIGVVVVGGAIMSLVKRMVGAGRGETYSE